MALPAGLHCSVEVSAHGSPSSQASPGSWAGSGRRCFPPMNVARMFDGKSAIARMRSRIHG